MATSLSNEPLLRTGFGRACVCVCVDVHTQRDREGETERERQRGRDREGEGAYIWFEVLYTFFAISVLTQPLSLSEGTMDTLLSSANTDSARGHL